MNLAQVASAKEKEGTNGKEGKLISQTCIGIFNSEPLLDLSAKHLQNLILNNDLSSMLKVREEALNYKIKKEKNKIQKLLSSQKISPRTGSSKELELEKWIDKEREEIDKTKQMYEENKRKTEEIIKETMGIDDLFNNFSLTQDVLKKLFAEKVITPREGMSFRSGFNSSRRLYELSQINKQINEVDNFENDEFTKSLKRNSIGGPILDNDVDNLYVSDHEESKDKLSLREKIEKRIKENQESTFENRADSKQSNPNKSLHKGKFILKFVYRFD